MLCVDKGKSAFSLSNFPAKGESYSVAVHNWRREGYREPEVQRNPHLTPNWPLAEDKVGMLAPPTSSSPRPPPFHPSQSFQEFSYCSTFLLFIYGLAQNAVLGSGGMPWGLQEHFCHTQIPVLSAGKFTSCYNEQDQISEARHNFKCPGPSFPSDGSGI